MEHVDSKTASKDIDDPGKTVLCPLSPNFLDYYAWYLDEYDEMMEIKKNVLKYVKGFDSFAKKKPSGKEETIPLLKDKSSQSTFISNSVNESD